MSHHPTPHPHPDIMLLLSLYLQEYLNLTPVHCLVINGYVVLQISLFSWLFVRGMDSMPLLLKMQNEKCRSLQRLWVITKASAISNREAIFTPKVSFRVCSSKIVLGETQSMIISPTFCQKTSMPVNHQGGDKVFIFWYFDVSIFLKKFTHICCKSQEDDTNSVL